MANKQFRLVDDKDVYQKERPFKATKEQMSKIMNGVAKQIIEWQLTLDSKKDIIDDLECVYSKNKDAFEMANELSGEYQKTSTFLELLESLDHEVDSIIEENVKDWVKAHDIKLKFKKGECLTLESSITFCLNKEAIIYIINIREETAEYIVNEDANANGGYVIKAELLEKSV